MNGVEPRYEMGSNRGIGIECSASSLSRQPRQGAASGQVQASTSSSGYASEQVDTSCHHTSKTRSSHRIAAAGALRSLCSRSRTDRNLSAFLLSRRDHTSGRSASSGRYKSSWSPGYCISRFRPRAVCRSVVRCCREPALAKPRPAERGNLQLSSWPNEPRRGGARESTSLA
jgi:hypothetical protein